MHASTLTVFETEYRVREVKSLMNDMPYGDPFSGTPYGQYHKSKGLGMVLGVVASVVTMGAALPMLASTMLATQIAGGVMMAGGVLSGVGAITGNKKLAKIGGVLSLAGGIGGALSNMTGGLGLGANSGSTAVQNMAGKMMESVNGLGINVFDPKLASSAANAGGAAAEQTAGQLANVEVAQALPVAETPAVTPLASGESTQGLLNNATNTNSLAGVDAASGATPSAGTLNIAEAPSYGAGVKPWSPSTLAESGPEVGLGSGIADPNAAKSAASGGIPDTGMKFIKDNPELTKIGMGALTEFGKSAMAPDESERIAALTATYENQANLLKTQNDILQYQGGNMQKQVAMISSNDPELDAKVKAATAQGIPVAFIPEIGAGGIKRNGNSAWGQGAAGAAQTPTRAAPVYGQPVGAA